MGDRDTELGGGRAFPQTTWWMVSRIHKEHEQRQAGLEELCQRYWKPIYCFVRRAWRKSNEDAKDLTQAFFVWLVDGDVLKRYRPEDGRFRHYLKGILRNWMRNEEQARRRQKRGGGAAHLPLHDLDANLAEVLPDMRGESPEEAFDRMWVEELIELATEKVRQDCLKAGHEQRFRAFAAYDLAPAGTQPTYAQVARELGVTVATVRNGLFAVREMLRNAIRAELRETVSSPEELEAEWGELFC